MVTDDERREVAAGLRYTANDDCERPDEWFEEG